MFTPTPDGFRFPSTFVGQYGVYDAISHLMRSDPKSAHLVSENSLKLSKRFFASDHDKVVQHTRNEFREKHGLSDDTTIVFYAPGDTVDEVNFTFE